jgi:HEAT repeat protein
LLKKQAPALEAALKDRDPNVREATAIALWSSSQRADLAFPVLLERIRAMDFSHRELPAQLREAYRSIPAIEALAEMIEPAGKDLLAALKHEHAQARAGAALIVAVSEAPSAERFFGPLESALDDRSTSVRLLVTAALRHLNLTKAQVEQLAPRLTVLLGVDAPSVQAEAIKALAAHASRSDAVKVAPIAGFLRDERPQIRARAVEAMGLFGPKAETAVPGLLRATKAPTAPMRQAAIVSLGQVGKASLPALQESLNDKDWEVRRWAAIALGQMGEPGRGALPALQTATKDRDEDVREAAAEAVKKLEGGK